MLPFTSMVASPSALTGELPEARDALQCTLSGGACAQAPALRPAPVPRSTVTHTQLRGRRVRLMNLLCIALPGFEGRGTALSLVAAAAGHRDRIPAVAAELGEIPVVDVLNHGDHEPGSGFVRVLIRRIVELVRRGILHMAV